MTSRDKKAKEFKKGVEVFEQMKREGLKPDAITYSALLSCCEKANQVKKGEEVCEQMKREGL